MPAPEEEIRGLLSCFIRLKSPAAGQYGAIPGADGASGRG